VENALDNQEAIGSDGKEKRYRWKGKKGTDGKMERFKCVTLGNKMPGNG